MVSFQLKITLMEVEPLIWRRVFVPAEITLAKLHRVIQAAMGWENCHLHEYRFDDARYGVPDPDFSDSHNSRVKSEQRVKLAKLITRNNQTFEYIYDFGDGWRHEIVVEEVLMDSGLRLSVCVDGERATPPEDIGGPGGYEGFLAAMADAGHAEREMYLEWVGGPFDPEAFDLGEANARLGRVK